MLINPALISSQRLAKWKIEIRINVIGDNIHHFSSFFVDPFRIRLLLTINPIRTSLSYPTIVLYAGSRPVFLFASQYQRTSN